MAKTHVALHSFNRGIISPLALARTDVDRTAFSAETMVNFMPRVLGSMILRPGLEYIGATASNVVAKFIPFVFSTDDTALIEVTALGVRVWEDESLVTRSAVTTAVVNGDFSSLTGWVDADDSGAVSSATADEKLSLIGDGANFARRRQTVSLQSSDSGVEMALETLVVNGPVVLRVGSGTGGTDNYISETTLEEGFHSIAFTPTADFVIEIESRLAYEAFVDSCVVAPTGVMSLMYPAATPWGSNLDSLRWDQSGNVVFIAGGLAQQYKIERRGAGSWSLVKYLAEDGPFKISNITNTTITASALTGSIILTASDSVFEEDPRGQLFRLTSTGQTVEANIVAQDTFTSVIKVEGVDSDRVFTILREGTWVATVTLQRSLTSDSGPWEALTPTWTTNDVGTYDDALDNQIVWYRIGVETGDYTSGTVELTLDYAIGSISGIARITSSPDNWIVRTALDQVWAAVTWSPSLSLFAAVALSGTGDRVMTSPDGVTWTSRTSANDYLWNDVAWSVNDDLYISVAGSGTGNRVMTSPDGIAWTARTSAADNTWNALVISEDLTIMVAVASSGTNDRVMTSADGVTWTSRTSAEDNSWKGVAYSKELTLFVAVASDGTNRVMTSNNGTSWTTRTAASQLTWQDVTWAPELSLFVAVSNSDSGTPSLYDNIMTSPDGITWTTRVSVGDYAWSSIVWSSDLGQFTVAADAISGTARLMTSSDGITWTETINALEQGVNDLTYAPELRVHVAVSKSGSAETVLTSSSARNTVEADVLSPMGNTLSTDDWEEGQWSNGNDWPTSVVFAEGRLWWAGKDTVNGSESDAFYNFDSTTIGDAGPISRTIGSGPVDTINWMLALDRIVLGAEGSEFVCKSSSFDEPLSSTNFAIRPASDQGSSSVSAVRVDRTGVFSQRGGTRLMQVIHGSDSYNSEYTSKDLTVLAPEVCRPQISRISIQRQPDTRIHCVLSDGTVAVLIYDRAEDVKCWVKVTTDGTIEDVVTLPGDDGDSEDKVYYVVNRTINGSTVRYLEKWAKESECEGASLSKNADSFISISQSSSTTIAGLTHLEAESVVVWGNGKDLGTYTVSSGSITVSEAVTTAIVGVAYTGQWKSSKLAYAANQGTALLQKKRLPHIGVILRNTHYQGLEYGPDFTNMDNLPQSKDGKVTPADTIYAEYDEETFEFQGEWNTDSRLCLQATAPKPCNILAAVVGIETREKF